MKNKKKHVYNLPYSFNNINLTQNNTQSLDLTNMFLHSTFNTENTLKFKDYKSSNAQFLGSERTPRLLSNLNSNSYKWNTSNTSNISSKLTSDLLGYGSSQNYVYSTSLSNWSEKDKNINFSNNII
jgi:hypothetical protein